MIHRLAGGVAALLTSIVALASAPARADVPARLPVQGYLSTTAGVPLDGATAVTFALYADEAGGAALHAETQSVAVEDGAFTAYLGDALALDLAVLRDATELWLGVTIGADPEMTPRLSIGAVAYAAVAAHAAEVPWAGVVDVPPDLADGDDDTDTTYAAGAGLDLTGTTFAVDATAIQARVASACATGQAIRAIADDGAVTCEAFTTYTAGDGLGLAAGAFAVDTTVQRRTAVGAFACPAGQYLRSVAVDGTPTCAVDVDTDTDTTYTAGAGLDLTGTSFAVDVTAIQARVASACAAGQAIRAIADDGAVTCETFTAYAYAAGAGLDLTGTTFAIDPAETQARGTSTCAAGSAIRAIAQDGTVTCEAGYTDAAAVAAINAASQRAFIAPTLFTPWANYGNGYATAGYYRDEHGFVHLRGLVMNGTSSSTVFVLPVGYRPAARAIFTVTATGALGRVDVLADGSVQSQHASSAWVSLEGITFQATGW